MTDTRITTNGRPAAAPRFAFVDFLDPLRSVPGVRTRYDCPDLATLDRHLASLHRRITTVDARSPDITDTSRADTYRADIDRLLDHRAWLTLPVVA